MLSDIATATYNAASQLQWPFYDTATDSQFTGTDFIAQLESAADAPNDIDIGYPGDLCCSFYKDYNFGGEKLNVCYINTDGSMQTLDLRDYGWQDSIKSYYCGKSIMYDFCNENSEDGICMYQHGLNGAGTIKSSKIGHHDMMNEIHFYPYDPTTQGAVTLFKKTDCRGASGRFLSKVSGADQDFQKYKLKDMWELNVNNDEVMSLMVPKGYTARLYEDDNRGGDK